MHKPCVTKPLERPGKIQKDSNAPRTYDPDGLRRRAACLCFKDCLEKEVLLISSTRKPSKWVVPGGGIDPGEDPETAAAREVMEEAGTDGSIGRLLGIFENAEKQTRTWVFAYYVNHMHDNWIEGYRQRKWFQLTDAKEVLSDYRPVQVKYLSCMEKSKS